MNIKLLKCYKWIKKNFCFLFVSQDIINEGYLLKRYLYLLLILKGYHRMIQKDKKSEIWKFKAEEAT